MAPDDLAELLLDWRTSLRAAGRQPQTIASYLTVGESFRQYAVANGLAGSFLALRTFPSGKQQFAFISSRYAGNRPATR